MKRQRIDESAVSFGKVRVVRDARAPVASPTEAPERPSQPPFPLVTIDLSRALLWTAVLQPCWPNPCLAPQEFCK